MNLTKNQKKLLKIEDNRKDYYFKVDNDIIDKKPFDNVYEFAVYTALSRYCNNEKIGFPSLDKLSENCYCSKPTIIKALNGLIKKGFINKVNRKSKKKGKESNLYSLNNIDFEKHNNSKEKSTPCKGDLLPHVKEIDIPCKAPLHKKEKGIKKKFKNYSSLESSLLNNFKGITKTNINRHLETTNEMILENSEYILKNKNKFDDIDKILYSSLKKGIRYNSKNTSEKKEKESKGNKKIDKVNIDVLEKLGMLNSKKDNNAEEKSKRDLIILKYKNNNKGELGILSLRSMNLELKSEGLDIYK